MNAAEALMVAYGACVFILVNGLWAWTSYLASRRLLPDAELTTRLTASCVVFIALAISLIQTLGAVGLYQREVVAVSVICIASVTHRAWRRSSRVVDDLRELRQAALATASSRGAVLLVLAAVAVSLAAWLGLVRSPSGWDSLTYHLPAASTYVQEGRIATITGPLAMNHDYFAYFPKNAEMLASWIMLPFHGDLLVGLMNLAVLVFCWIAFHALARALEVSRPDSALAATALCTSPFLYSWVATQNADTLVVATLAAGLVFLARYVHAGAVTDASFSAVAVGLAVGTKVSALAVGGLVLVTLAATFGIRRVRAGNVDRRLAVIVLGAVLATAAVGARQYVVNTASTGNPVYPLSAPFGLGLTPSTYAEWLEQRVGPGNRSQDYAHIVSMFHYAPSWRTPMSAGPKFVLLIALAVVAVLQRNQPRAGMVRLLVLFAVVTFGLAELPSSGFPALSRRVWPAGAARFLGIVWTILCIVGFTTLSRLRAWQGDVLRAALVGFTFWDLVVADRGFAASLTTIILLTVLVIGATVPRWSRRPGPRSIAAATAAALIVGCVWLDTRRAVNRWPEEDPLLRLDEAQREFRAGWRYVDEVSTTPRRIAFAAGEDGMPPQNWFIYPLMGRRLQNRVVYIPLNADDPPGSRPFLWREHPRAPDWLAEVERQRVDLVFVQGPWPIEDQWMREHPERFAPVFEDPLVRVYETRSRRPSPPSE